VRGNRVRYLADGRLIGEATDTFSVRDRRIGLWSQHARLTSRSFRVIKL
jgi:hypothetical protein